MEFPDREKYIKDWAKKLGVDGSNEWYIVEEMVRIKNYDTATAMIFGLSWKGNREYLDKATKSLKEYCEQYNGRKIEMKGLYDFMVYYTTEVQELPKC